MVAEVCEFAGPPRRPPRSCQVSVWPRRPPCPSSGRCPWVTRCLSPAVLSWKRHVELPGTASHAGGRSHQQTATGSHGRFYPWAPDAEPCARTEQAVWLLSYWTRVGCPVFPVGTAAALERQGTGVTSGKTSTLCPGRNPALWPRWPRMALDPLEKDPPARDLGLRLPQVPSRSLPGSGLDSGSSVPGKAGRVEGREGQPLEVWEEF